MGPTLLRGFLAGAGLFLHSELGSGDDLWKQVSLSPFFHPFGLLPIGSHPANSLASCCQPYRHEYPVRLFFHSLG